MNKLLSLILNRLAFNKFFMSMFAGLALIGTIDRLYVYCQHGHPDQIILIIVNIAFKVLLISLGLFCLIYSIFAPAENFVISHKNRVKNDYVARFLLGIGAVLAIADGLLAPRPFATDHNLGLMFLLLCAIPLMGSTERKTSDNVKEQSA